MISGIDGSSFSVAQGATEYGRILRFRRSNVTGPKCPPCSVTKASTSLDASRHDGCLNTVFLVILILIAVFSGHGTLLEGAVRLAFKPFCHQHADRSFIVLGNVLPVCARCTGFYAGLAAASLISLLTIRAGIGWRVGTAVFLLAIPLVVDGMANSLGLWNTPNMIRAATGVCAAVPLALALMGSRNGNV